MNKKVSVLEVGGKLCFGFNYSNYKNLINVIDFAGQSHIH